jgi:hypothetical protein
MRLMVDFSGVSFQVTHEAKEKLDQDRKQKRDRVVDLPLWVVEVMALDDSGGQMINLTLAAATRPGLKVGSVVVPVELEAIPWSTANGKSGVAFRVQALNLAGSGSKAA